MMSLSTDRLILRPHRPLDIDACQTMWSDPEVARFTIRTPSTIEQTWGRMLIYRGHWEWVGYGYWVVEEKVTGDFVGEVGFADFKRIIEPSLQGIPEMGWVLTPSKQGLGYATEAVQAALEWGRKNLQVSQVACMIDKDHSASMRVAEKCGFQNPVQTSYRGTDTLIFYRPLPSSAR